MWFALSFVATALLTGLITVELSLSEDGRGWDATGWHRYLAHGAVTAGGERPLRTHVL